MTTKEIMELIERFRCAGGREEHHAYKEELEHVLDDLVGSNWLLIDVLTRACTALLEHGAPFRHHELRYQEAIQSCNETLRDKENEIKELI